MVPIAEIQRLELYRRGNPFESQPPSPLSSSPSSSDEELYSHALTLHAPMEPVQTTTRRPAPPPPRTKPFEREETSWLCIISIFMYITEYSYRNQQQHKYERVTPWDRLNQTLFLQVVIRLPIIHVPFVIFKFLHGLLLEYFMATLLFQFFCHYLSEVRLMSLRI